jgi:hypothetical protein
MSETGTSEPFRQEITGMRKRLIHEYFRVDLNFDCDDKGGSGTFGQHSEENLRS